MNDILEKYNLDVINKIDEENMIKIIKFLEQEKCLFIKDILEDYIDIFTINFNEFIDKYNKLNIKYNNEYLKLACEDMNKLEELFYN